MRYCLFCREAFQDDVKTCPYCGDPLTDRLPEEGRDDQTPQPRPEDLSGSREETLLQVAIITSQEDLENAVAVLKEEDIYFEIDEVDRRQAEAGLIPGRAWRLLVEPDEAPDAFMGLVKRIPQAFPRSLREQARDKTEQDEQTSDAATRIEAILDSQASPAASAELAKAVVFVFSSGDIEAIARSKRLLARHGAPVAPLLTGIAVESAASGGEGAERVLFHAMQILEALGYKEALPGIQTLYSSPVPEVRTRASYAAGRLGAIEAVDGLLGLLEDEDEQVRYEASEAIWRLTGLDFEFEPNAPVEHELENIARLRERWARARQTARVRGKITLTDLLKGFQRGP